jgi:hypothetical protein
LYEQLFDLHSDPREQNNLAAGQDHQPLLQHLRGRWSAWRDALDGASANRRWSDPR